MKGNRTINDELYSFPIVIARDMPSGETGSIKEIKNEKYLDRFKEVESYTGDECRTLLILGFIPFDLSHKTMDVSKQLQNLLMAY